MALEKLTTKQVATRVELEGLGYAVQSYLSPERIEDKQLRALWKTAQATLNEIEHILAPYMDNE